MTLTDERIADQINRDVAQALEAKCLERPANFATLRVERELVGRTWQVAR